MWSCPPTRRPIVVWGRVVAVIWPARGPFASACETLLTIASWPLLSLLRRNRAPGVTSTLALNSVRQNLSSINRLIPVTVSSYFHHIFNIVIDNISIVGLINQLIVMDCEQFDYLWNIVTFANDNKLWWIWCLLFSLSLPRSLSWDGDLHWGQDHLPRGTLRRGGLIHSKW